MSAPHGLLAAFARHRVAANLLMTIMLLAGVWAFGGLNTQFFPNFAVDIVSVRVEWRGATAEDVEEAITTPLEDELRDLDGLDKLNSTSAEGVTSLTLEFQEGTDMGQALDEVKERVARLRNLPETAEDPKILRAAHYDIIARVLLSGELARSELRELARSLETDLLERGIAKVEVSGLPDEEVAIQVPAARLDALGITVDQLAARVAGQSRDLPAGEVGSGDIARQLRSLDQRRDEAGFERLPLQVDADGSVLRLGDIARIERRPRDKQVLLYHQGKPAVELLLQRAESEDALAAAKILDQWVQDVRPRLPPTVQLEVFDERWTYIEDRINLLLKNGAGGLLLVIAVLFLFLNGRVAFWVTVGIPVSFMAALAVLYVMGGSINMISLFGLIMTLGIIVDDAIVVGEDALAHYESGEGALQAAEGGAARMLAPVLSSSLTTIAAFLPLMAVGGIIGNILFDIPFVVICVILASLVESFLVLPGHLRHAFGRMHHAGPGRLRARLDGGFDRFRDGPFRRAVDWAVHHRGFTLAAALGMLILSIGLVAGGRLPFTFFPKIEGNLLYANVSFVAGTPQGRVADYLAELEQALYQAEAELGGGLIVSEVSRAGSTFADDPRQLIRGDNYGSVVVELISPDLREVRNRQLIERWRARLGERPGLESLTIREPSGGPPGRDVDVELAGAPAERLKLASEALQEKLKSYPGVSAIADDLPYGQEQYIYSLTDEGRALGLTVEEVGRQLRSAFDGRLVQIFQDGGSEVEVRVMLPDAERRELGALQDLRLRLPGGGAAPLTSLVTLDARRGFETLRHGEGRLAVHVTADVDSAQNNANLVLDDLEQQFLPQLRRQYGITTDFAGRAEEQAETFGDMGRGLVFAMALIYLVLAWVFASYGWPLVVMAIIPFGLVGAFLGHFVMGLDLTILSLFGVFGLTGIVVNDSIILVTFFKQLRERGKAVHEALVEAAVLRLRAVLLTSLTTIGGLLPLLFETSLQAQFLIPMAVSISFGLAGATLLVLFVIPALLSVHEDLVGWLGRQPPPPAPALDSTAEEAA